MRVAPLFIPVGMMIRRGPASGLFKRSLVSSSSRSLYDGEDVNGKSYEVVGGYCRRREGDDTRAFGRFAGKVAVVTGAAGNFGEACAERLAREGASVALLDIRATEDLRRRLVSQTTELPAANQKVSAHACDVTDFAAVEAAIHDVVACHGRIDYLCNNAGYQGTFVGAADYDVEDWHKVMSINVDGVFHCLKAVAQVMRRQSPQGGAIVQTASMAGHSAPPNMPAYATSKAAVVHATKACAKDLSPFNIRVNSVSPAFIGPGVLWTRQIDKQAEANSIYYDTDPDVVKHQMIDATPLRRYGTIDEVIGPILFLFSDDASYLTGVDIQVTGGIN
mmetsp:Transcript_7852/g.25789  ORF Transcript_7852/g.25789 Transcript_7852/m.25789 type:complete len:334 (+) Transcript_7852:95-1096(+)